MQLQSVLGDRPTSRGNVYKYTVLLSLSFFFPCRRPLSLCREEKAAQEAEAKKRKIKKYALIGIGAAIGATVIGETSSFSLF